MLNFAAPTVAPMNVSRIRKTRNSLMFGWDEIPCDSTGGENIVYEYSIGTSPPQNGTTSFTNITLNNLTSCTTYEFTVRARNEEGTGPPVEVVGSTADESKFNPIPFHELQVFVSCYFSFKIIHNVLFSSSNFTLIRSDLETKYVSKQIYCAGKLFSSENKMVKKKKSA